MMNTTNTTPQRTYQYDTITGSIARLAERLAARVNNAHAVESTDCACRIVVRATGKLLCDVLASLPKSKADDRIAWRVSTPDGLTCWVGSVDLAYKSISKAFDLMAACYYANATQAQVSDDATLRATTTAVADALTRTEPLTVKQADDIAHMVAGLTADLPRMFPEISPTGWSMSEIQRAVLQAYARGVAAARSQEVLATADNILVDAGDAILATARDVLISSTKSNA